MRVLIVGAGITGLSLGAMLRRLNIDCFIVERAPHLQAVYQAPVVLWSNALSCLRAFDIDQCLDHLLPEHSYGVRNPATLDWLLHVKNRAVKLPPMTYYDQVPSSNARTSSSHSYVAQFREEKFKNELSEVPLRITISSEVLKNSLRMHCQDVRFGQSVVGLEPATTAAGGVNVTLDSGRVEWADVLVGADGLHSTVRQLVYPDLSTHHTTSQQMLQVDGCVRVTDFPQSLGGASCSDFWGQRKSLSYFPMNDSIDGNVAHFSALVYDPPKELVQADVHITTDMCRQFLSSEFSDCHPEIIRLLKNLEIAQTQEVLQVPLMPQWHNYRATLAGDAAHGTYPSPLNQDCSLCIEDAAVLATALMEVPMPTDTGFSYVFKRYERTRRNRIEQYRQKSDSTRRFVTTKHGGLRNRLLQLIPGPAVVAYQNWLTQWAYSGQCLLDAEFSAEGVSLSRGTLQGTHF